MTTDPKDFSFDPKAQGYSAKNSLQMAKAVDIAYMPEPQLRNIIVTSWGITNFHFIDSSKLGTETDTQAFIAYNDDLAMLVYRGTEPKKVLDWASNADILFEDFGGVKVHSGFLNAYKSVNGEVQKILSEKLTDQPLWIAGHSLGGAIATLATYDRVKNGGDPLKNEVQLAGLYTYGSPRVGNEDFRKDYNRIFKEKTYRMVNNNDVVTRVPPQLFGYGHIGRLKYIKSSGQLVTDPGYWARFWDSIKGYRIGLLDKDIEDIKDHERTEYIKHLSTLS
ncbi:MAG: lipase family protein [SAR324 cluster bacterium]|nr:lipase family protein [SAR324 cluster bacterium]